MIEKFLFFQPREQLVILELQRFLELGLREGVDQMIVVLAVAEDFELSVLYNESMSGLFTLSHYVLITSAFDLSSEFGELAYLRI